MKKITEIEKVLDLKPDELAGLTDCSISTYYRYRNGQSKPTVEFFDKIIKAVPKLNPEWLFKSSVPVFKKFDLDNPTRLEIQLYFEEGRAESVIAFPFYILDNNGVLDDEGFMHENEWEKAKETFLLNTRLFDRQIPASPADLIVVEVNCHILAPDIPYGTLCLVDINETKFSAQGIYLVKIHHLIKFRRIQLLTNGSYRLSTNSPLYRDLEVEPEEEGFRIMGKVVWIGRQL